MFKYSHGRAKVGQRDPTYETWRGMRDRCSNPKHKWFKNYGGRGIRVCDRWQKFENFLADMGERPKGKFIDRIRNPEGYQPGNCRWVTRSEQMRNTRVNKVFTVRGITACLAELCETFGVQYARVYRRIRKGMSVEDAIFTLL